jgi:hypothetical protein
MGEVVFWSPPSPNKASRASKDSRASKASKDSRARRNNSMVGFRVKMDEKQKHN